MAIQKMLSIGAAARLSGLSPHTLRKWEDRYGAFTPERTPGGDRRYSAADIERSLKLKALVDSGRAIRSIAGLPTGELDQLISAVNDPTSECGPVTVAVLSESGAQSVLRQRTPLQRIEIVGQASGIEALAGVDADLLVIEIPSLTPEFVEALADIRAATDIENMIILYKYGSLTLAESLSNHRTAVLGLPLNFKELERIIFSLAGPVNPANLLMTPTPSRFSRATLADVAQISSSVACECPRHVAHLLIDLTDFEAYSQQCEDLQNDDAVLHIMLRRTAATARSLFESALIEIAQAEDIDLNN